jgi:hypothetical protein
LTPTATSAEAPAAKTPAAPSTSGHSPVVSPDAPIRIGLSACRPSSVDLHWQLENKKLQVLLVQYLFEHFPTPLPIDEATNKRPQLRCHVCGTPGSWRCPAADCDVTLCTKVRSHQLWRASEKKFVRVEMPCYKLHHLGCKYKRI